MNSLAILLACSLALSVQGISIVDPSKSCTNTRSIFEGISVMDTNGNRAGLAGQVFNSPLPVSNNVCGLSETCCSSQAERSFSDYIVGSYRDKMVTKLSDPLMTCHNHTFFGEFKTFLESAKADLVSIMRRTYGIYFLPYLTIYDQFYAYLQSTVDTGDICRIEEEWNEVFYEVYLAAIISHPATASAGELPQTDEFRECFHDYFQTHQGDAVDSDRKAFLRTYTRAMRYFRALKTMDNVIESIVAYTMESECKQSVMKMTHCSSCAGYSSPTCEGMCLNVLRGCLVDLSDLFEPLEKFGEALIRLETQLDTQNGLHFLWGQLTQLNNIFLLLITKTSNKAFSIQREVLNTCAPGHVVKREAAAPRRVPRTAELVPRASFSQSAHCLTDALALLKRIPEAICSSDSDNTQCWNGQSVGSYGREVIDFDKDLQFNNPEIRIKERRRSLFEQEIANLKSATRDLDILTEVYECGEDDEDEDCTVPDTCSYYNLTNAPIPEIVTITSGSGSTSAEFGSTMTDSPPSIPTTPSQAHTEESTSPAPTTSSPDIPGDTTVSFPGPEDPTNRVTDDGGFGGVRGGSPALLSLPGTIVLLISLLSLLLL